MSLFVFQEHLFSSSELFGKFLKLKNLVNAICVFYGYLVIDVMLGNRFCLNKS